MIPNVFVIPDSDRSFIIYLPLSGILFKANSAAVNLLYQALNSNKKAQSILGISDDLVQKIIQQEEKYFCSLDNIREFKPTSVTFFMTSKCSMRCIYCYAHGGDNESQMKFEYIEAALREVVCNALVLRKDKITISYHGGGDISKVWSLLVKATVYIKQVSNENNINVDFHAGLNGVLSDNQRKWIVNNIKSATVSLDGYPDIQNRLRPLKNGQPSFELVDRTLKYFDSNDFRYTIRSTITSDSVHHLEKIVAFFINNYKVRKIMLEPVFIQGRALINKVKIPGKEDFVKNYIRAQKIANAHKRKLSYSGARFDHITNKFCKAPNPSFGITPDGDITSCYEVLDASNPVSDIFFYGKIADGKVRIFPDKLKKLTALTLKNSIKCQKCFAKFHCAGDCLVKSILSEQIDELQDLRCTINRELTKYQLKEVLTQTNDDTTQVF